MKTDSRGICLRLSTECNCVTMAFGRSGVQIRAGYLRGFLKSLRSYRNVTSYQATTPSTSFPIHSQVLLPFVSALCSLLCTELGDNRLQTRTEISALLGYYAALSGSSVPTFRDNLSGPKFCTDVSGQPIGSQVLYRRFGTTYRVPSSVPTFRDNLSGPMFCTDVSEQPIGSMFCIDVSRQPIGPMFCTEVSGQSIGPMFCTEFSGQPIGPMVCTDVSGQPISPVFCTDVSGQPICPIFKGQEVQPIGCPETSVQNYNSTLCNIPEDRISHLHRGGSLKSRK
jgi:hypothetical protein